MLAFITRWIVNAILLKVTDVLTSKLTIRSFGSALLASLLIALVGTVADRLFSLPRTSVSNVAAACGAP